MVYRSPSEQRTHRPACDKITKGNFALVAILTILSTAMTAYVLNAITSLYNNTDTHGNMTQPSENFESPLPLKSGKYQSRLVPDDKGVEPLTVYNDDLLVSINSQKEWQPQMEASEGIETRIKPNLQVTESIPESLSNFREKLASMSRIELLKLLEILQERIEKAAVSIRKRNVNKLETAESITNPMSQEEGLVIRSAKMQKLIGFLDEIQSSMPNYDKRQLDSLSSLDKDKSTVKIVKPFIMDSIFKTDYTNQIRPWQDSINSVAPEAGWSQPVELEDWPSQTTAKPKKKKKKKKLTTTTTTTTTTSTTTPIPITPAAPDTSTIPPTPAPPTASEEVWIEEEEDIFRPPPRKKTKKYKKKTSPPPTSAPPTTTTTTTSTTTSTTTTTTTPAPTTTTVEPSTVEDWPNDPWPSSSTKAPWPDHVEEEKWPEEEWLNAVKNHVQDQLNVIYI